jgi:hypothetical protein
VSERGRRIPSTPSHDWRTTHVTHGGSTPPAPGTGRDQPTGRLPYEPPQDTAIGRWFQRPVVFFGRDPTRRPTAAHRAMRAAGSDSGRAQRPSLGDVMQRHPPTLSPDDDPLRAARGLLHGLLLSVAIDALLVLAWRWPR